METALTQLSDKVRELEHLQVDAVLMEGRLDKLERMLQERPATLRPVQATYEAARETPAPADIPPGSMLYGNFAKRHGVKDTTFRDHIRRGLVSCIERPKPGRPGETERWLTPADQAAAIVFWQQNGTPHQACADCPRRT